MGDTREDFWGILGSETLPLLQQDHKILVVRASCPLELSAVSYQPSAISRQLSAVSYQPSAISRQPLLLQLMLNAERLLQQLTGNKSTVNR